MNASTGYKIVEKTVPVKPNYPYFDAEIELTATFRNGKCVFSSAHLFQSHPEYGESWEEIAIWEDPDIREDDHE